MHKINYLHCEEWHYIERYHCKICGSGYKRGVHKSWGEIALATTFCAKACNICGSPVWNLLHVMLPAPKNLSSLLDFWKFCDPPSFQDYSTYNLLGGVYKKKTNLMQYVYWQLQNCSTCFGRSLRPSSGALGTIVAASGLLHEKGWGIQRVVQGSKASTLSQIVYIHVLDTSTLLK